MEQTRDHSHTHNRAEGRRITTVIRVLLATGAAVAGVGVACAGASTEPPDSSGEPASVAPSAPVEVTACVPGVGVACAAASTEPPDSSGEPASVAPPAPDEVTACIPGNTTFRTGSDDVIALHDTEGDLTLERRRGFTWRGAITSSDPRLEGTHFYSFDSDAYTLPGGGKGPNVFVEGHRIDNEDGAWQGSAVGLNFPDGSGDSGPAVLIGEGAYEGLTAVLGGSDDAGCFLAYHGYIMEVPPPPVPYTGE